MKKILEDNQLPLPLRIGVRLPPLLLHLLPLLLKVILRLLSLLIPQDQMILMSMVLVYLLSLPFVFVYFFAYNTFSKNRKSMKKKINHQNDVICFRSYIINE